jgi:hypothetical protein
MTLISASELAGLREVAESGMTTPATVQRRVSVADADGQHSFWTDLGSITGWLYSTPTPMITVNAGEQVTVNTYRWFCPVGTDLRPGDKLTIGGSEYTVSDTTAESTWLPLMNCSLRRIE